MNCCSASLGLHPDRDGPPHQSIDINYLPDPIAKYEPLSRHGNPAIYKIFGKKYHVWSPRTRHHFRQVGIASWYGTKFHRKKTSSGECYDMFLMTAAHRSLPLPTYARVTNLENYRSVMVKINDRGPFKKNRILDLSYAAAKKLDLFAKGTALIELESIDPNNPSYFIQGDLKQKKPKMYLQVAVFDTRSKAIAFANTIKKRFRNFPIYLY